MKVVNLSLSGLDSATADELDRLANRVRALRDRARHRIRGGDREQRCRGRISRSLGRRSRCRRQPRRRASLCVLEPRRWDRPIGIGCDADVSWPGGGSERARARRTRQAWCQACLAGLRAYRSDLSAPAAEELLVRSASNGRLDAAAGFRTAGLGWLVEAASADAGRSETAFMPTGSVPVVTRWVDALAAVGVRSPRVRTVVYAKHVLRIDLTGVPDFGRAVFRIDGRRYIRATGRLRLRLRHAPRLVSVSIDVPGLGTTASVRVAVRSSRRRAQKRVDSSSRSAKTPTRELSA